MFCASVGHDPVTGTTSNWDALLFLLANPSTKLELQSDDRCYRNTALCWAVARGQAEAVELLLAAGADRGAIDSAGSTPLQTLRAIGDRSFHDRRESARCIQRIAAALEQQDGGRDGADVAVGLPPPGPVDALDPEVAEAGPGPDHQVAAVSVSFASRTEQVLTAPGKVGSTEGTTRTAGRRSDKIERC